MRVVLFAGKGGVGRTTAAAATALLAARSAKVLLVSSGALGVPAGPDPVPVGDLQVLHVDVRRSFEARWPGSAAELALPPGAAELLTLLDAGAVKDDYVLDYTWDGDRQVSWTLVKGQMQKRQDGSYTLVEKDGSTEVTYSITIDLSIPMLGMIKRKAEKVILDTALKELKKRVES